MQGGKREGAGRKPLPQGEGLTRRVNFMLDPSTLDRLDDMAWQRRMTRGAYLRTLIRQALEALQSEN